MPRISVREQASILSTKRISISNTFLQFILDLLLNDMGLGGCDVHSVVIRPKGRLRGIHRTVFKG